MGFILQDFIAKLFYEIQLWGLEGEGWSSSPHLQSDAVSSRISGHPGSNVWIHQARDSRLGVVKKLSGNRVYAHVSFTFSSQTLSAMCIENLDGDYYIPGTQPDGAEGVWREAQDSKISKKFEMIYVDVIYCNMFQKIHSRVVFLSLVGQEATEDSVILWALRVQSDYNRKAPKTAPLKQKAYCCRCVVLTKNRLFWNRVCLEPETYIIIWSLFKLEDDSDGKWFVQPTSI